MKIGMVGLGRMGGNMAARLLAAGHEVVVFDIDHSRVGALAEDGAIGARTLHGLLDHLDPQRTVWLMLPAGAPTNDVIAEISSHLSSGDVLVDGGNSHYEDARRWSSQLLERGIDFVDVGVSGGLPGRVHGYCLMIGGGSTAVRSLEPIFSALAPPGGHAHVGPPGAGHYAKMIHNGIEYGLLEAYAEGFAMLDAAPELIRDSHQLATLWNRGSVVRSWLLELTEIALADPQRFAEVDGHVADSGEGRWTVEESTRRAVPTPVIAASLYARYSSRQADLFGPRLIAALRHEFGGHPAYAGDSIATSPRQPIAVAAQ